MHSVFAGQCLIILRLLSQYPELKVSVEQQSNLFKDALGRSHARAVIHKSESEGRRLSSCFTWVSMAGRALEHKGAISAI